MPTTRSLVLFVLALLGLVFVVLGNFSGPAELVLYGLFVMALPTSAVVMIRRGRNRWWLRSWLDSRRERS